MKKNVVLLLAALLPSLLAAQAASSELIAVNDLFSGAVIVKIDRKDRFVFDVFENGQRIRQDVVNVEFLDPANIHFSSEESALILGCRADRPQCFQKEVFKQSTIRLTGRCNLACPSDDAEGARTIEALKAMIIAAQASYADGRETKVVGERRK